MQIWYIYQKTSIFIVICTLGVYTTQILVATIIFTNTSFFLPSCEKCLFNILHPSDNFSQLFSIRRFSLELYNFNLFKILSHINSSKTIGSHIHNWNYASFQWKWRGYKRKIQSVHTHFVLKNLDIINCILKLRLLSIISVFYISLWMTVIDVCTKSADMCVHHDIMTK